MNRLEEGVSREQALNRLHAGVWKAMRCDSSYHARWWMENGVRMFKGKGMTPRPSENNIINCRFYEVNDAL